MPLLLNCDLGESYGSWSMGMDSAVMPFIDQANIACGFHGGDPLVMSKTLSLAKTYGTEVGAHPSYPDLMGFGRRSMHCSTDEIKALVTYQVAAMDGMASTQGLTLSYIKPHGALYNDMMAKDEVRHAVMDAVANYHRPLRLMLQATADAEIHRNEAKACNIDLYFEAFADRCYADDGRLLSRSIPGAVHDRDKMLAQVKQLSEAGSVTTVSGKVLELYADTLCVHGDNVQGVQAIETIRGLIHAAVS